MFWFPFFPPQYNFWTSANYGTVACLEGLYHWKWFLAGVWDLLGQGLNQWLSMWWRDTANHGNTGWSNSLVQPEGVRPDSTPPYPHLRAGSHKSRISTWILPPSECLASSDPWKGVTNSLLLDCNLYLSWVIQNWFKANICAITYLYIMLLNFYRNN